MNDAHACRLAAAIGAAALLATAPVMAAPDAPSWLQVCAADTRGNDAPASPALRVRAGPLPDGCRGIALPVAPGQIAAVRPATLSDRVTDARTILIYRPERADQAGTPALGAVETVLPPAAATHSPAARTAAPLHVNLLDRLQLRPYGVEERVQAHVAAGRLTVQCRGGGKPAGVLLSAPWAMPRAALVLAAQYQADGVFSVALADDAASADERALDLGRLGSGATHAVLPLPASGWDRARWRHIALACPGHAATLAIGSLQLQPQPSTGPVRARATWIWRAKDWIGAPAAVLAQARRHGMRSLFITVPTQGAAISHPARLAAFARQASRAGIELWAVEGDPHMALPAHHAATADRVRAVAAYNRGVEPAARLQGVQFDIEHYLIDGYGMASERHDLGYAQLLAGLKAAAGGLPLDFVVPFWWHAKDTLLAALAQAASIVTVMDYRTDEEQIRDFATPFLDWGVSHGVGVRIALESGAIAPERQHRYVRAEGAPAELWAITLSPEQTGLTAPFDALVLLKQPQAGLPGTGFRYSGNRLLDGSATTFQRQPARLQVLLPQLERDFSAWSSFAGMAVHEPGEALPATEPAATPDRPPSGAR